MGRLKKYLCLDFNFVSLSLGALGLVDDILKIKFENSRGLKSSYKFLGQIIIGIATLLILIEY